MRAFQLAKSIGRGARRAAGLGLLALAWTGAAQAEASYSYSRTSAFTYQANGLLASETVEPDQPNLCVTTTYTYGDNFGNKTAATTSSCAGASSLAQFQARGGSTVYDTQQVTVGGNTFVVPMGTFATSSSNALNQTEQRRYDPRFGAMTQLTGPNGLVASWSVDEFGRKALESRADGTSTAIYYCWIKVYDPASGTMVDATPSNTTSNSAGCANGASPAFAAPSIEELPATAVRYEHSVSRRGATAIGGYARVYFDRLGRKVRVVAEGFDGDAQPANARLIVQDTDYNDYGVAVVVTQPYFLGSGGSTTASGATYGLTMTEYDVLGRATTVYSSDPTSTGQSGGKAGVIAVPNRGSRQMSKATVSYSGATTVSTDDEGRQRTEEKNLEGQVVRATDAMGAQVVHQYDAFGNLVITRDPLGNRIVVDYDTRGRKTAINDPDGGVTVYCHDALGQVRAQQTSAMRNSHTPGGCPDFGPTATAPQVAGWTTLAYDLLGRLVSRAEPEFTTSWAFDNCAMGVGKLCQSSTSHGVTRKLAYDSLGRATGQRTDIAGDLSAATALSFDDNGRVLTQTYPTGVKLRFRYTAKGFLSGVLLDTKVNVGGTTLPVGSEIWKAGVHSAWGKAERSSYGNGIENRAGFDSETGRTVGLTSGAGGGNAVVNQRYSWDSIGLLKQRVDAIGDTGTVEVSDGFSYDALGRLTAYAVSGGGGSRTVTLQYNALGMLLSKSDVGNYVYGPQGVANGKPHAVLGIKNQGQDFRYDLNGNATSATGGKWRSVTYTSFNMADVISGAGPTSSWKYDESHQRIKETKSNRITWYLHPDNAGGLGFEREIASDATQSNRHYIGGGGETVAVLVTNGALPGLDAGAMTSPEAGVVNARKLEYWHKDQLGSLIATTDHAGTVTARYAYDPFGKRRYTNSSYDPYGNLVVDWRSDGGAGTDRGFTGHEHLDDMGIVHMNGRLYDPTLGRMMQPDPFVQEMLNLQNYDRYGYCYNSPLVCTDPSGYSFFSKFWKKFRPIIITAVVLVVAPELLGYLTNYSANFVVMGVGGSLQLTGWGAAISGFTAGAISSGNLRGALQGGFSASMFNMTGDMITNSGAFAGSDFGGWGESSWQAVAAHGVAGCVTSTASGGKCGSGALSAAFSKAALPMTAGLKDGVARTLAHTVIGGTASVLGGGKFANGAQTGAFSYLFNHCSHDGKCFTTSSERALLDKGDFAGYYKAACDGNDAYACQAGEIAAGKSLAAVLTTVRLIDFAADNGIVLTQYKLNDIRLKLATGYADYLGDSAATAKVPSAMSIAEIHWNVFDTYGLPPRAFGGTPLGTLTPGGTWYTKQYPFFIGGGTGWCPKCTN